MNSSHLPQRVVATLIAVFAAAAISAAAQAYPAQFAQAVLAQEADEVDQGIRPDDRASRPSPSAVALRPDDRAFRGIGPAPSGTAVHPSDRAVRISPEAVPALPATGDGFDWSDAGLGAVGAFALVLVAAGASVAGLRSRRTTALS